MKLMETRQSRLSSSDVSADARHTLSYQADTPASRFPSTSNVSPSSLVATSVSSDDNLATKFRHHLLPYHRRQQQMTDVETTAGSGQYRPDLWQATRSPADDAMWSPLQRPLTQPPHVLALYGAQIWASLVSSLFADNLTGTSASADVSAATTGARNQRSTTLRRTAVPHGEQATSPSTDEAVPQRNTVANWLLDSPSPSSPSVSATTTAISAAAASETTSAFDAAGRLLEQVRQYRCLFVDGVGNVDGEDRHRRHARVVGGQTTMSGRAADDARAGGFSCCLCLKRHATQGAMKMHAKTHTLPCRCVQALILTHCAQNKVIPVKHFSVISANLH